MAAGRWLPREELQALLQIKHAPVMEAVVSAYGSPSQESPRKMMRDIGAPDSGR